MTFSSAARFSKALSVTFPTLTSTPISFILSHPLRIPFSSYPFSPCPISPYLISTYPISPYSISPCLVLLYPIWPIPLTDHSNCLSPILTTPFPPIVPLQHLSPRLLTTLLCLPLTSFLTSPSHRHPHAVSPQESAPRPLNCSPPIGASLEWESTRPQ